MARGFGAGRKAKPDNSAPCCLFNMVQVKKAEGDLKRVCGILFGEPEQTTNQKVSDTKVDDQPEDVAYQFEGQPPAPLKRQPHEASI